MNEAELQKLLQTNHEQLLLVIDALPFPIYYKDTSGRYLGCNKAYEEYVDLPRQELIGKNVFQIFDEEPATIFDLSDKALFQSGGIQIYETEVKRENQQPIYVKFHKSAFHNEDGTVAGLIGAIIDITELKELEKKFKHLASYDDLTEIYNRREGRKQLKKLCQEAKRKERPISVILIDLDNFKLINDTYGHDTGDLVLKKAASCLDRYSRAIDVLCRYGGEEFLVVLPETATEEARQIAERYREKINQLPIEITSGDTLQISASLGVAEMSLEFTDRELMLKQADQALYRAKAEGKNRVCC